MRGPWEEYRYVLGPWPWMVIIYRYWELADAVVILRIYDGRTGAAPLP